MWGVGGAAAATVISQYTAGVGILIYCIKKYPQVQIKKENRHWNPAILKELLGLSSLTCLQQSVMNFGILMVQGLVNSFGPVVMAAFAAAVKIAWPTIMMVLASAGLWQCVLNVCGAELWCGKK